MESITAVAILSAIVNIFMVVILRDIIQFNSDGAEQLKKETELWQKSAEKWRAEYDKILQKTILERSVLFNKLVDKPKSDDLF